MKFFYLGAGVLLALGIFLLLCYFTVIRVPNTDRHFYYS